MSKPCPELTVWTITHGVHNNGHVNILSARRNNVQISKDNERATEASPVRARNRPTVRTSPFSVINTPKSETDDLRIRVLLRVEATAAARRWGKSGIRLSQPTTSTHAGEPGPKRNPTNAHDTESSQRSRESPPRTPPLPLHETQWSPVPNDAQASARDECVPPKIPDIKLDSCCGVVVVVVSDTCESVCMCTTPQTCRKLLAN